MIGTEDFRPWLAEQTAQATRAAGRGNRTQGHPLMCRKRNCRRLLTSKVRDSCFRLRDDAFTFVHSEVAALRQDLSKQITFVVHDRTRDAIARLNDRDGRWAETDVKMAELPSVICPPRG
jgi:hypothetical protein